MTRDSLFLRILTLVRIILGGALLVMLSLKLVWNSFSNDDLVAAIVIALVANLVADRFLKRKAAQK